MSKPKTVFHCQSCGTSSPKWVGRCPSCNEWNTFVEEVVNVPDAKSRTVFGDRQVRRPQPTPINQIDRAEEVRMPLPDPELNRVLGGGIVSGSLILMGGEPGIGKSTLLLQTALRWPDKHVLYISGEESEGQIRMRAERIGLATTRCDVYTETSTTAIFSQLRQMRPDLVIVDSVQTLHSDLIDSPPGSVSQIRECAGEFLRYAKESGVPVVLVGHITKDGTIAGPKVLEHMVDTVLQFEGDRHHMFRMLRSIKNRFGSTPELGIYEMSGSGLQAVTDPSSVLAPDRDSGLSGVAIAASLEGIRPMLIEVQALVSSAVYGTPQRSTTGFDLRRLNMLLAVLEKRCGFRLGAKDVFLNITGGIRVDDPALDLGVICAVLSSSEDIAVPSGTCLAAEVGLSGEIRPISRTTQRIDEAAKMGMSRMVISKRSIGAEVKARKDIEIIAVARVDEAFKAIFG